MELELLEIQQIVQLISIRIVMELILIGITPVLTHTQEPIPQQLQMYLQEITLREVKIQVIRHSEDQVQQ